MTTWIGQRLIDLSACLADELTQPTCWHGVWPGEEVPMDFCAGECDDDRCGMAYVRMSQMFPSTEFPVADAAAQCTSPLAYEIMVGVTRCAPVAQVDGSLPDPEEFAASALLQAEDQAAMVRAIRCCMSSDMLHVVGLWLPIGPLGGCVGGQMTVMVAR